MSGPIDHDEARTALLDVVNTALAALSDVPEVVVRDPRYLDADADDDGVRSRVSVIDGPVRPARPDNFCQGSPPTWDLEALFYLRVEGLAPEDADRQARVAAIRKAISPAIAADFTLGGVALFAELREFDPEDIKTVGETISTFNTLAVAVQFVSLTQTG